MRIAVYVLFVEFRVYVYPYSIYIYIVVRAACFAAFPSVRLSCVSVLIRLSFVFWMWVAMPDLKGYSSDACIRRIPPGDAGKPSTDLCLLINGWVLGMHFYF